MRLIDADALNFTKVVCDDISCGICPFFIDDFCKLQLMIDRAPTIDAEPVIHAHWIDLDTYDDLVYMCDNCKSEFVMLDGTPLENDYNYCPYCGAKMMNEVIE